MSDAVAIAIVSGIVSLLVAIVPKIIDAKIGNGKKIEQISDDVETLKADVKMITDVNYTVLKHLATNNNTGNIQRCLDAYWKYQIERDK